MRGVFIGIIIALLFNMAANAQNNVVLGEYIVMLNTADDEIQFKKAMVLTPGFRLEKLGDAAIYKVSTAVTEKLACRLLLNQLKVLPMVKMAQENHIISQRNMVPNDPNYLSQWQYNNTGQNGGTFGVDLDAELAWDVTTGGITPNGDTIVIAILDAGFQLDHPDLAGNLWVNSSEISDNGIDDDDNGYVDDYYGWNPSNNSDNVGVHSHGTAVAGIIGANGNNGLGVAGVNWNVKMMLLSYGDGNEADVVASYLYILKARKLYNATNGAEGAYVVATNASFGLDNTFANQTPIWCAMYDSLGAAGIISAGATANNNVNVDITGDVPSTCPSPYLIAVTNINSDDEKVANAGYGIEHIDIGAFGEGTYTATTNSNYSSFRGTSAATPHVAGAVGLLYAAPSPFLSDLAKTDPANATLLVKQLLIEGSEDNASLQDNTASGKRLNLNGVIQGYMAMDALACFASVNLFTSINSSGQIIFSWENLADSSYFYYSVDGAPYDSVSAAKSFVLQNLPLCTNINWYVRAVCENGLSDASVFKELKSPGCCLPPAQVRLDSIFENGFYLSWDSVFAFQESMVRYKFAGQSNWLDSILTSNEHLAVNGLDPCTNYEVDVRTICAIDSTSIASDLTTFRTSDCPSCFENYCEINDPSNEYEWIETFTINGVTANSGKNVGYNFFGNQYGIITLERQESISLSYKLGASTPSDIERLKIYIDHNQNFSFESNELVFSKEGSTDVVESGSFQVSNDALLSSTRMRVQLQWRGDVDGCSDVDYGEIEDYCITIKPSTVGIPEKRLADFNIYPNPANSTLHITGVKSDANYVIINSIGKQIKAGLIKQDIDIVELPNGVYLIQIENSVKRFIKQ
jgi:serine protease